MSGEPVTISMASVKAPRFYRWLVLLACSAAMFCNYYVFDALYPVTELLQQQLGFTDGDIGSLDAAYNWAAIFALIGGVIIIDRLGTARSAVLFGLVSAAGAALIAFLPALVPSEPKLAMITGRFVLGVGSELFIVAATTVVGRWFKGKEISFALAIQLLIARLGSLVADKSPGLARELFTGWQPPLVLAAGFGAAWAIFAIVYAALESHAGRRYGVKQSIVTDKLVLSDLVSFPRSYWWVVGLCVAFYSTIFPFRTFANLYFIQAHGLTNEAAGDLKAVLPMISMIGMPLFGIVADRIGRRAMLMTVGSFLLVPPFLIMTFWNAGVMVGGTPLELVISMASMGLAFAMVPAVLWPAVTYLVPESRLGSAYALMTLCQQIGWMIVSKGIGEANDALHASAENPSGWLFSMLALAVLSASGFVFSYLLWRDERGTGGHGLERPKPIGA